MMVKGSRKAQPASPPRPPPACSDRGACALSHSLSRYIGRQLQVRKTLDAGLTAILCVGETKDEYEAKLNKAVCALQLSKVRHCGNWDSGHRG